MNLEKMNLPIFYLSNHDFINGTYRVIRSGRYILKENIIFSPNANYNFQPSPLQIESGLYKVVNGPYTLGFFAAIAVETENVIIDLNYHSIEQGREFYLRQRFFNIIELANSPFIPKQGPGKFGSEFISAKNCLIKNGKLGLSSHNGIHGNNAKNITITQISITDFEVGGISLNGSKNITINDVRIENSLGTYKKVPVNGRFSSFIFISRMLETLGETNFKIKSGDHYIELDKVRERLLSMRERVIQEFLQNRTMGIQYFSKDIYDLFGNPLGLPDGSAIYGILFNKSGIAINDFGFGCCNNDSNETPDNYSNNINISKVLIRNLVLNPREIVGIKNNNGLNQDFSGNTILLAKTPWFENLNCFQPHQTFIDKNGHYDILLSLQVLLSEYSKVDKRFKGVGNVDKYILKYVKNGNLYFDQINPGYKTYRNSDVMNHVMKGIVGIRCDFTYNLNISDYLIHDLKNVGKPGIYSEYLGKYISGKSGDKLQHLGHPKSNKQTKGYTGNSVRGISLSITREGILKNGSILNLVSYNGPVYGIDFIRNNSNYLVKYNTINNLYSCSNTSNLRTKLDKCESISINQGFDNEDITMDKNKN